METISVDTQFSLRHDGDVEARVAKEGPRGKHRPFGNPVQPSLGSGHWTGL